MAYFLRFLLVTMFLGILITVLSAKGIKIANYNHIELALPTFIFTIFIQAFVMFYFIGVSRLATNIFLILSGEGDIKELFDNPPEDLTPYLKKAERFHFETSLSKRKTIPWTMLMLVLGTIGFLLGGAHHTGMVSKTTHSGVIYGFSMAAIIGFFRQWYYLGISHKLLRELKTVFSIPDSQM